MVSCFLTHSICKTYQVSYSVHPILSSPRWHRDSRRNRGVRTGIFYQTTRYRLILPILVLRTRHLRRPPTLTPVTDSTGPTHTNLGQSRIQSSPKHSVTSDGLVSWRLTRRICCLCIEECQHLRPSESSSTPVHRRGNRTSTGRRTRRTTKKCTARETRVGTTERRTGYIPVNSLT